MITLAEVNRDSQPQRAPPHRQDWFWVHLSTAKLLARTPVVSQTRKCDDAVSNGGFEAEIGSQWTGVRESTDSGAPTVGVDLV